MSVIYRSYGAGASTVNFAWSGLNTNNQFSSLIYVPTPGLIVTSISCYWAGRGGTASGYHAVWDSAGAGTLMVASGVVTASAGSDVRGGQAWYTSNTTATYIPGGKNYYVGVFCTPSYPRYTPQWTTGQVNTLLYQKYMASIGANNSPTTDSQGVLACYITGNVPGMKVNDAGTWKSGTGWVNDNGVWTQGKAIWVNDAGTWKQSVG